MQRSLNPRAAIITIILLSSLGSCQTDNTTPASVDRSQQDKMSSQKEAKISVPTERVAPLAIAFKSSDKILSEIKHAGFSVDDPNTNWGITAYVDASRTSGGFRADGREGMIKINWDKVVDATSYAVFRSSSPVIPIMMEKTLTMDTGISSIANNYWSDNDVGAGMRLYYVVMAIHPEGKTSIVATGDGVTPGTSTPRGAIEKGNEFAGTNLSEAADRETLRQEDGTSIVDGGKQASDAANGTYAFIWAFNKSGHFLIYTGNEPDNNNHPFEIHKRRDGSYSLIGFVDASTEAKIKPDRPRTQLSVYANKWSGATKIVSLPVAKLTSAGHAQIVMIGGKQRYVMHTTWN